MISYFEIGGHIVECLSTSLPSSQSMVTAAERPERGRNSAKAERGVTPETSARKASLFAHWQKTSFHHLREFAALPGKRKTGLLTNPRALGFWGITHGLEVVEMHYDYFLN